MDKEQIVSDVLEFADPEDLGWIAGQILGRAMRNAILKGAQDAQD